MKPIPSKVREYVKTRDTLKGLWICRVCGRPAEHIHHIFGRKWIPYYLGIPDVKGQNHEYNLISLCAYCHLKIHNSGISKETKEKMINGNKRLSDKTSLKEFYINNLNKSNKIKEMY